MTPHYFFRGPDWIGGPEGSVRVCGIPWPHGAGIRTVPKSAHWLPAGRGAPAGRSYPACVVPPVQTLMALTSVFGAVGGLCRRLAGPTTPNRAVGPATIPVTGPASLRIRSCNPPHSLNPYLLGAGGEGCRSGNSWDPGSVTPPVGSALTLFAGTRARVAHRSRSYPHPPFVPWERSRFLVSDRVPYDPPLWDVAPTRVAPVGST